MPVSPSSEYAYVEMRKRPARSWVIPVLATITATLLLAAGCSGDGSEEAAPTNDVSADICAEGAADCDDTVDEPDHTPNPGDNVTAAPTPEICSDAASCQERVTEIARRDLASQVGVEVDAIVVVSTEAVDWPDACLDAAKPGTACAQVITPGFKIVPENGGKQYEYHTDNGTRAVLLE